MRILIIDNDDLDRRKLRAVLADLSGTTRSWISPALTTTNFGERGISGRR